MRDEVGRKFHERLLLFWREGAPLMVSLMVFDRPEVIEEKFCLTHELNLHHGCV
jgi:hypothetical protein